LNGGLYLAIIMDRNGAPGSALIIAMYGGPYREKIYWTVMKGPTLSLL
jgi:hypothetical protein